MNLIFIILLASANIIVFKLVQKFSKFLLAKLKFSGKQGDIDKLISQGRFKEAGKLQIEKGKSSKKKFSFEVLIGFLPLIYSSAFFFTFIKLAGYDDLLKLAGVGIGLSIGMFIVKKGWKAISQIIASLIVLSAPLVAADIDGLIVEDDQSIQVQKFVDEYNQGVKKGLGYVSKISYMVPILLMLYFTLNIISRRRPEWNVVIVKEKGRIAEERLLTGIAHLCAVTALMLSMWIAIGVWTGGAALSLETTVK